MPGAKLRYDAEKFESLMRRYNRAVEKSGILQEVRRREYYEKPSVTRKRAKQAAIRRQRVRTIQEKLLGTKEGQRLAKLAKAKEKKEKEKYRDRKGNRDK